MVHHRLCKFAVGVPNTATNLAVYGELGRVPLEIKRRSAIIKYWLRIVSDWNTPALLKEVYVMQTESGSDWLSYIEQTLAKHMVKPHIGTQKALSRRTRTKIKGPIYSSMEYSQLSSTTGKLRFYKLFKTTFEREPYLHTFGSQSQN